MTYREAWKIGTIQLQKADVPDAEHDAKELLFLATGMSVDDWLLKSSEKISENEATRFSEYIGRRAAREPLQQITGVQYFCGLPIHVTKDTLCPRQETEVWVDSILPLCRNANVLDMCTGTGCIAISIAKLGAPKSVTAADISKSALAVARDNADINQAKVEFIESDMFAEIKDTYDIIVSNPPYIPAIQMKTLMPEVKDYEPEIALYGGEDGLDFYRIITKEAVKHLRKDNETGGYLVVEIGFDQGVSVPELFRNMGFSDVKVIKDYAGLDRVVMGHL